GEYTIFEWKPEDGTTITMEKAYLKQTEEGRQWWRVSWTEEKDTWIYEALLSPQEERLVRLRARDAEGNEGEVPVTEGTVYAPPAKVSDESIEGASVGKETLTTPAGKFSTNHVVFMGGGGTVEWWLSEEVPGGVVKYLAREGDETFWTCVLAETGDGATTKLNSY
ncbi:MAG: hypothetical protein ACOC7U_04175, partial [Spirochaetota bacterium]